MQTAVRVASVGISALAGVSEPVEPAASVVLFALAALAVNERLGCLRYRKYETVVLSVLVVRVHLETVALSASVETAGFVALSVLAAREHLGIEPVVLW